MYILSFDMGKTNMACSLLWVNDQDHCKYKLIKLFMVRDLISDLKIVDADIMKQFITSLLDDLGHYKYHIDVVNLERFMSRGMLSGTTMECVNIMIGLVSNYFVSNCPGVTINLYTAAQWKNNLKFNLNIFYKACCIPNHPIDAFFIGLYSKNRHLGNITYSLDALTSFINLLGSSYYYEGEDKKKRKRKIINKQKHLDTLFSKPVVKKRKKRVKSMPDSKKVQVQR